jgi:hypothetical protein
VDLSEALGVKELTEQLANTRLESHEGLVGRNSQIDDSIVQTDILTDIGRLAILRFLCTLLLFGLFVLLIFDSATGIFDLER